MIKKERQLLEIAQIIKERELANLAPLVAAHERHLSDLNTLVTQRRENLNSDASAMANFAGATEKWLAQNAKSQAKVTQALENAQAELEAQKHVARRAFGRAQVLAKILGPHDP